METEKLYYQDSFCRRFTATVLDCREEKGQFQVILDRTAFYPEGGGQPADQGTLGAARVLDVREKEGEIRHLCDRPLTVGETVTGELDWVRRFDHMQAHSGEHMVSGWLHRLYGYHNVGFHMGAQFVTIDFDGPLTEEEMRKVEDRVNQSIWEDREVEILWPDSQELKEMEYRSKKELEGAVRIVRFPETDTCACCGTHVHRGGQVGLVKLLTVQPFRSGVRIEMLAGRKALEYLTMNRDQNRAVGQLLSVKPEGTLGAVTRLKEELTDVRRQVVEREEALFARETEAYEGAGDVLLFQEGLSPDGTRRLAAALTARCKGRGAVFSGKDGSWQYAIGQSGGDLRAFTKEMNQALGGRGGGKPDFVQGGVTALQEEIEGFFQNR